jgi:hypothetical protein
VQPTSTKKARFSTRPKKGRQGKSTATYARTHHGGAPVEKHVTRLPNYPFKKIPQILKTDQYQGGEVPQNAKAEINGRKKANSIQKTLNIQQ